jgi:L-rhamnose mutarotase
MGNVFGMTLQLRDDPAAIERYKAEHQRVWPEVTAKLRAAGVREMHIFLRGRRLFMCMEAAEGFDPARDLAGLNDDPHSRRWDELMRTLQEPAPEAGPGEWWAPMETVFDIDWPQHQPGGPL